MNKTTVKIAIFIFVISSFFGCTSTDQPVQVNEPLPSTTQIDTNAVDKVSENFLNFLGFNYGDTEDMLTARLGNFTSGNYSADSSSFIYYFKNLERVPIEVWVNSDTKIITTIFMEILSLNELFSEDLETAKTMYQISENNASWFGLTADEIKTKMGTPSEDAMSNQDVHLLTYDSPNFLQAVTFKIYKTQENICSSVSVNWFYN
ncbi:MAG: hypothetical protein IT222_07310 [Crocinitomix sp.]|nr:hypothetical protein [Crocinitomix sp.]